MYTPENNPYIPGDPYSYDLKWLVSQVKQHSEILADLDEKIAAMISEFLDQHDPVYYSNAEALINSDQKNGSLAFIEGFYTPGDGGDNLYFITTDYNDIIGVDFYLTMNGANRWAIPVILRDYVTPVMFGAATDGSTDASDAVQICLDMLHNRKAAILDLIGKTYIINKPLHADSMYKCTIKNGTLKSTDFQFGTPDENFILRTTEVINQLQPESSGGYCFEDNRIENVTFDANLQSGLGCLSFGTFMRIVVTGCDFRRYSTYGLKMSDLNYYDAHEMIVSDCFFRGSFSGETNTTGEALHITKHDNIFTDIVIVGAKRGIYCSASYNEFSKIHTYGNSEYGVYLDNAGINSFSQIYFDGEGLYMYQPAGCKFTNCMWYGKGFNPITLDKAAGYYQIGDLKFIGCSCVITEGSEDLITLPTGVSFDTNYSYPNLFDFTPHINTVNNAYTLGLVRPYDDFTNDVTFTYTPAANTKFVYKNGFVYLTYDGPNMVNVPGDDIATLPAKYAPSYQQYGTCNFIDKLIRYIIFPNGKIRLDYLEDSTSSYKIVFSTSFPIANDER